MAAGDLVNVVEGQTPTDYHCSCNFCKAVIGELRQEDGSYYSRLERRKYYSAEESGKGGHIAKTPLHIARWAIQQYSQPGDWVLDPTIGAGTTAVEAITQGRNVAGMEIEFGHIVMKNIEKAQADFPGCQAEIEFGDARNIGPFLDRIDREFSLVVNNPPYSGDVSMPSPKGQLRGWQHRHLETKYEYNKELPNLAHLNVMGDEYATEVKKIYSACIDRLKVGGHIVIGVKDMSKNWQPLMIHQVYCRILEELGMEFVGTSFLNHYPRTLFLNTYTTRPDNKDKVKPPYYQTINVFRKPA
jgi:hypothetical protein